MLRVTSYLSVSFHSLRVFFIFLLVSWCSKGNNSTFSDFCSTFWGRVGEQAKKCLREPPLQRGLSQQKASFLIK